MQYHNLSSGLEQSSINQTEFDLCIVGAGVTGASLAAYLGKRGYRIALIEKEWQAPERIVGELLQPDGIRLLKSLGLSDVLNNIDAQIINGYAIILNGESLILDYPTPNTFNGLGLSNKHLLEALRRKVQQYPNIEIKEGSAEEILFKDQKAIGVKFKPKRTDKKYHIKAKLTIASDGFYSKLRKGIHKQKASTSGYFLGMELYQTQLPFPNYGHVFIQDNIKFLAYPINTDTTRILIEKQNNKPALKSPEMKDWLNKYIGSQLPENMLVSFNEAVEKANFKMMPGQILPAHTHLIPGIILMGDALNMRSPLTGGGMTAGLSNTHHLAQLIINTDLCNIGQQKKMIAKYQQKCKNNSSINILADALNQVFSDDDLANACFEYLKQGESYANEPLSLLSGLNRNETLLLKHFFAVAVHGASKEVRRNNINGISKATKMLRRANGILAPLMYNENQGKLAKYFWQFTEKLSTKNNYYGNKSTT